MRGDAAPFGGDAGAEVAYRLWIPGSTLRVAPE
ncbi:MAG: hypothetical protein QOD89_2846 [Bradyrhizobium sp.]|jgi:hypothetical protein|nr:hypothetical protein [Bradyrhizobium sp.]